MESDLEDNISFTFRSDFYPVLQTFGLCCLAIVLLILNLLCAYFIVKIWKENYSHFIVSKRRNITSTHSPTLHLPDVSRNSSFQDDVPNIQSPSAEPNITIAAHEENGSLKSFVFDSRWTFQTPPPSWIDGDLERTTRDFSEPFLYSKVEPDDVQT